MRSNLPKYPEDIKASVIKQNYLELDSKDIESRSGYIKQAGWYILNAKTLKRLVRLVDNDRVVEVFSGTGYLSYWLNRHRDYGLITKAYDNRTWCQKNVAWIKPYYGSKKNAFRVNFKSFDTVIMCWPAYDKNHAYRIVRKNATGTTFNLSGRMARRLYR